MLKLETTKMTNAIAKAKTIHPKVSQVDAGEYRVIGSKGDKYIVTLGKANGLYLGECTCPAKSVCYHIAAACSLHIALKRGYSKEVCTTCEQTRCICEETEAQIREEGFGSPINWAAIERAVLVKGWDGIKRVDYGNGDMWQV